MIFIVVKKLSPIFSKRKINDILEHIIEAVSHWDKLALEQAIPTPPNKRNKPKLKTFFIANVHG